VYKKLCHFLGHQVCKAQQRHSPLFSPNRRGFTLGWGQLPLPKPEPCPPNLWLQQQYAVGVGVDFVVLACVLRARTKKGQLFCLAPSQIFFSRTAPESKCCKSAQVMCVPITTWQQIVLWTTTYSETAVQTPVITVWETESDDTALSTLLSLWSID